MLDALANLPINIDILMVRSRLANFTLADARMNEMQTALGKVPPGVFTDKIYSLERRLYHPRYDELTPEG